MRTHLNGHPQWVWMTAEELDLFHVDLCEARGTRHTPASLSCPRLVVGLAFDQWTVALDELGTLYVRNVPLLCPSVPFYVIDGVRSRARTLARQDRRRERSAAQTPVDATQPEKRTERSTAKRGGPT